MRFSSRPLLTVNVVLNICTQHSWATTGSHPHIQIGPGITYIPPKRTQHSHRSNSTTIRPVPAPYAMSCVPSEPTWPHMQCTICPHTKIHSVQECPLLVHDHTSSAGIICHVVCPIRAHMRYAPYARSLTRMRNRES